MVQKAFLSYPQHGSFELVLALLREKWKKPSHLDFSKAIIRQLPMKFSKPKHTARPGKKHSSPTPEPRRQLGTFLQTLAPSSTTIEKARRRCHVRPHTVKSKKRPIQPGPLIRSYELNTIYLASEFQTRAVNILIRIAECPQSFLYSQYYKITSQPLARWKRQNIGPPCHIM